MSQENQDLLIHGAVDFGKFDVPTGNGTEIHLRLQDTGRADAGAQTLAELVLTPARLVGPTSHEVPYALGLPVPRGAGQLTLRVWVRCGTAPSMSVGDYVTKTSYPVAGRPGRVELNPRVERIDS